MSTVTVKNIKQKSVFVAAPYGNALSLPFKFTTTAAGVFSDSDLTTAVQSGDVVRLGILPAGLMLTGAMAIISDTFASSTTGTFGFKYVDGVDDSNVPEDADYFHNALDTASAARSVATNTGVTPVTLPKDAYLTLTVGGAAHSAAGRLDYIVEGIWMGPPSAIPS